MKYILYIFLLLFTYSCSNKKATEKPTMSFVDSNTIMTLPANNAVIVPPYGSKILMDSIFPKPIKNKIKVLSKKQGRTYWRDFSVVDYNQNKNSGEFYFQEDSVRLGLGASFGVNRMKVDSSIGNEFKRHITLGVEGDTETMKGGDSVPKGEKIFFAYGSIKPKPVYDTLKTIVSYVDTSVEARPNVIDWKYLYYVRRIDVLFSRDNYYLELDKKRIKSSIVVLEARILDPK